MPRPVWWLPEWRLEWNPGSDWRMRFWTQVEPSINSSSFRSSSPEEARKSWLLELSLWEVIEAIFFAVPRDSEFKLGAILFSPLADSAAMESFFGRYSLSFELPPASFGFISSPQLGISRWSKENEIV